MSDIEVQLKKDLAGIEVEIKEKLRQVKSAKDIYNVFFILAICCPLLLATAQVYFTWNSLIFDPTNAILWSGIKEVFSAPIGSFAILAATAGMFGFKHRAKQLDLQQLGSRKQSIMASLQFELATKQFKRIEYRENFKLYLEHRKWFREQLETYKNKIISVSINNKPISEGLLFKVDENIIYEMCFPNNSTTNGVKNIEINLDAARKNFDNYWSKLDSFYRELYECNSSRKMNHELKNEFIEKYNDISELLINLGIIVNQYRLFAGIEDVLEEDLTLRQVIHFCDQAGFLPDNETDYGITLSNLQFHVQSLKRSNQIKNK